MNLWIDPGEVTARVGERGKIIRVTREDAIWPYIPSDPHANPCSMHAIPFPVHVIPFPMHAIPFALQRLFIPTTFQIPFQRVLI